MRAAQERQRNQQLARHERRVVQTQMTLWNVLRRAREGEPLSAGEGRAVVEYYETLLREQRDYQVRQQQDVERQQREAHREALHQTEGRWRRHAHQEVQQVEHRLAAMRRMVRYLCARVAAQFGSWHYAERWAELMADPMLAAVLRDQEPR